MEKGEVQRSLEEAENARGLQEHEGGGTEDGHNK